MSERRGQIAITGATGLIGAALCRRFAAAGFSVRALARKPGSVAPDARVAPVRWDLRDAIGPETFEGCDAVIHAAYAVRGPDLRDASVANEHGAEALLKASRAAGVPRFIFVSSMSVNAAARSAYALSKLRIEERLDPARDLAIRPGLVLARDGGLFSRMAATVRARRVIPLPDGGRQPIQTVHIDDLCEAFTRAVDRNAVGRLTIAEPEPVELRVLLRMAADRLGRQARFVAIPAAPTIAALRLAETLGLPLPVTSENLRGLLTLQSVDTRPDLARLDLTLRGTAASLDDLLP